MAELKNQRHERFCRGIIQGLSATAAYTAAGYKGGSHVRASASQLLAKQNIADRIHELKQEGTKRTTLSVAMVIQGYLDLINDPETPHSTKRACWRDLGEHLAMFTMKHKHTISMEDRISAVMAATGVREEEARRAVEEAARVVGAE